MNVLSSIKKYKNSVIRKYIFLSKDEIGNIEKGQWYVSKKIDGQLWFYVKEGSNSKIINASDKQVLIEEGCLSFPNLFMKVSRPEWVEIEWFDEKLNKSVDRFTNIWAQCIQHEIDHLDGKLFIDRVSKLKYEKAKNKQSKINDQSR